MQAYHALMRFCPHYGGRAAVVYVAAVPDPGLPAEGHIERDGCQGEGTARLSPSELIQLAPQSSVPVDWSPEWRRLERLTR